MAVVSCCDAASAKGEQLPSVSTVAGCEMDATIGSSVPQRSTEGVVSVESESVVIQILREVLESFLL